MVNNERSSVRSAAESNNAGVSAEDVAADFRAMVKSLRCPHCDHSLTDAAVDWGDAWREGRIDTMAEYDEQERDGPCKVKCEMCGGRSWIDYFARAVTKQRQR